jgi:hypothetical protein
MSSSISPLQHPLFAAGRYALFVFDRALRQIKTMALPADVAPQVHRRPWRQVSQLFGGGPEIRPKSFARAMASENKKTQAALPMS